MDSYGCLLILMNSYGFLWNFLGILMDFRAFCGFLRIFVDSYRLLLVIMDYYGLLGALRSSLMIFWNLRVLMDSNIS